MSDDKQNAGNQDRLRINVNEDYELRNWSATLGVSHDELKNAVKMVGPMVEDVKKYLRK